MKPNASEFTGVRPLLDSEERTRFVPELADKLELLDASPEFWLSELGDDERLRIVTLAGSFTCFRPDPKHHAMTVQILESELEDLAPGEEVSIDGASLGGPIALHRIKRFCGVHYSKVTEHELTAEDMEFIAAHNLLDTYKEFKAKGKIIQRGDKEFQRSWDGANRYTPEVQEAYRFFEGQESARVF